MATLKQKKAIALIAEGKSVSRAMAEAGYAPGTAKNPKQLTESKGFAELLEKTGITDEMLANKLKEGLEATKLFGKEAIKHPDYSTQHKFLETNLRLKGHSKELNGPSIVVVPIYAGRSTE